MKITKRQLKRIIKEEYHRIISESVKDIATEMQNYLDHLIRETSMSGRMDPLAGEAFDALDVLQYIKEDANGAGIIYDYFPNQEYSDFVLASDADEIDAILGDMVASGLLEPPVRGTTKMQGRYWNVYYLQDDKDYSAHLKPSKF